MLLKRVQQTITESFAARWRKPNARYSTFSLVKFGAMTNYVYTPVGKKNSLITKIITTQNPR